MSRKVQQLQWLSEEGTYETRIPSRTWQILLPLFESFEPYWNLAVYRTLRIEGEDLDHYMTNHGREETKKRWNVRMRNEVSGRLSTQDYGSLISPP